MTTLKYFTSSLILWLAVTPSAIMAQSRWHLSEPNAITWTPETATQSAANIPHSDHIEMSGKRVSTVLRYGVDADGRFQINKSMVWPMLRGIPNDTHASLMRRYSWDPLASVTVAGMTATSAEKVEAITLDGSLLVKSNVDLGRKGNYKIIRNYFPSTELPSLIETYQIINTGKVPLRIEVADSRMDAKTDPQYGVDGTYTITAFVDAPGFHTLAPGDTLRFNASLSAYAPGESKTMPLASAEKNKRMALVDSLMNNLVLETPDSTIDRMFAFSKIRACESIYDTKGGPMHGPGGESYYAAIWANDQAEYVNPFFPFTGYGYGNQSAVNSFKHFARFMNDSLKPIPSSIIAEGLDIWDGAGDRGDAAMIAYGASRFALASGNKETARELWPLISWCLDYCKSKINGEGVVASDSDELEGRFPSGDANLCTSSLYYDALVSASYLSKELGLKNSKQYLSEAKTLRKNIEKYFGKDFDNFHTYAYYEGNDKLRAWICIPLVMGIDERAKGTLDALFSPRLWTENGLLSEEGDKTFWDRATLYALRGAYTVGETERATDFLHRYSTTRLLGDHVPYAIEAWPEGSQRHLSAESGLYARIITEGLFGIRPTGLHSFTVTPRLPDGWDYMNLRNIRAFGGDFDLEVKRLDADHVSVTLIDGLQKKTFTLKNGVPGKLTI